MLRSGMGSSASGKLAIFILVGDVIDRHSHEATVYNTMNIGPWGVSVDCSLKKAQLLRRPVLATSRLAEERERYRMQSLSRTNRNPYPRLTLPSLYKLCQ